MRLTALAPASLALASVLAVPTVAVAQDEPVIAQAMDAPFFVTWQSAAVRSAPDGGSDRLATLDFGERVFITGMVEGGEWARVETDDGTRGFVWAELLAPMRMVLPGSGDAAPMDGAGMVASDDNTFELAEEIIVDEMGMLVTGSVGSHDSGDFYTFTVDQWTDVVIDLYDLSADVDLALYDEERNFIADSVMGGTEAEYIAMPIAPGRYFIEVYSFEGDTTYEMAVSGMPGEEPPEDAAGSTRDTAFDLGVVPPNGSVSHTDWVGPGDATDYVSFTLEAAADVTVEVYDLSQDVDMSVEDDFGSILGSSAMGGSDPELVELTLDPGTYYVSMVPFSGSSSYVVEVSATAATPAPVDEGGDGYDDARDLGAVGPEAIVVNEYVGTRDTEDYYRFEVAAETMVTIVLDPASDDADIRLYTENGGRLIASSELGGSESELIEQVLAPGVYHLQVSIFGRETEYRLEVMAAAG